MVVESQAWLNTDYSSLVLPTSSSDRRHVTTRPTDRPHTHIHTYSCVVIFFSALSGLGYEEPNSTPSSQVDEKEFDVGRPVFDGKGMGEEQEEKVERMKRLEQQWAKQKRPKDVSV